MRRYFLSKKRIKEVKSKLAMDIWADAGRFEVVENDEVIILRDGRPAYFIYQGRYYPTVHLLLENTPSKYFVTVDMGAVKYVLNGANIFAAGIVDADRKISKGDGVYVRDEKYHKPLAVGIAMMSGEDMVLSKEGLAVKSIHHYGDRIFKMF